MGVARRDTTPPAGIFSRMWGAARHDRAEGIHRPLSATVLALRAASDDPLRLLVALDLPLLGEVSRPADAERVLGPVREALDLGEGQLIVNCSHTHAAPPTATSRSDLPGGELIGPYLDQIGAAVRAAADEAVSGLAPSTLTWATGSSDLATNRDLPAPEAGSERILCGFNPAGAADDTLVVGRVTRASDDGIVATVVNYACHPTTLAWENTLISPDFVGAMRELVERETAGAPCLFLQGASGELAPAYQYVADPRVADQHGRRLGFSALAALSSMLPPGQGLGYEGLVESGAPLALWRPRAFAPPRTLAGGAISVELPLKPMPPLSDAGAAPTTSDDRALAERLFRRSQILGAVAGRERHPAPAWVWQVGESLIVAHPNEAYSRFQQELRRAFPGLTVVVMNTSGAELGYLYPADLEALDLYQVWQTPFAADALLTLTDACIAEGRRLLATANAASNATG